MDFDKITIIITTFHSEKKILNCLKSIDSKIKVIVIENSNNLNFKNDIEKNFVNVECVLAGKNLGYAKGNNLGLSKVKSQYALILNPDATLEQNTIENFLKSANLLKDFAIIGPARQKEFSKEINEFQKDKIFETEYLKGFAMFLNLDQFTGIGFFDENFFIYLEEIDLCKRLRKENKKIFLDSNIKINHLGGSSHDESVDFEMELSRNWHWMWSKFYFNKKHYGFTYSLLSVSGNLLSSVLKIFLYTITFNKKKRRIYFQRFSGLLNSIIGKKSWYRPKIFIN
tara:strand:+ start:16000 stop:16851 length:852 start_codon:yes stop_codon:yes gene_type:complete